MNDSGGRGHHDWTVPALFNPLRFINDLRYIESKLEPLVVQDSNGRVADVEFVQKAFSRDFFGLETMEYNVG